MEQHMTIDLWQHDFGDASLLDYVKDITLEELTRGQRWICWHSRRR